MVRVHSLRGSFHWLRKKKSSFARRTLHETRLESKQLAA
jgi:hypothetical protein